MSSSNRANDVVSLRNFRRKLLGGTALVAVVAVGVALGAGQISTAFAAGDGGDGTTQLDGATAITADTVGGLIESAATGSQTDTINVQGTTDLILGAEGSGGNDSITLSGSASALALTINVIDGTPGGDTFTLAGDIELANAQTDTLALNIVTTGLNATLTGDVTTATGSSVTITLGDGAGGSNAFVVNTVSAQNLAIAANFESAASGDTSNLSFNNTQGGANTITVTGSIGATVALDDVSIDAAVNAPLAVTLASVSTTTLSVTSNATGNETASATLTGDLTASGAVTIVGSDNATALLELRGTTNSAASFALDDVTGLASLTINATNGATSVAGTINGAATTEGTLNVIDDDAGAAGDAVTFSSIIGGSNALVAINIGNTNQAGGAVFGAAVSATTITIDGGDAGETTSAEFQDAITATTIVIDNNVAAATLTVNATNGAKTVAGTIDGGTAGDGTLAVIDDDAGVAPDQITFSGVIGGTSARVGAINVGNSTQGGSALFTSANPVVVTTVTVTGGDNAAEDSIIELQDALTATSVTLNDSTGTATININTTNGAQTIAGTFDGAAAGEGTLGIFDDDAGTSDLATFSGNIGGTSSLSAINIGTATQGGEANFAGTSAATTVTITGGNAASENSSLVAVGTSAFTNLTLTGGGNASADATAEFQATGATLSTTSITLDDATGQAELTFNATNGAQAVTGTIDGAAAGEGKLIITDDDAGAAAQATTFAGNVGATNSLLAIEVGTVGGAALAASAVFSGTTAATTITLTAGDASGGETALATFTGDLTATTLALVGGGDAAADAIATISGNATTAITLNDATGQAQLVFNGTGAGGQTISGTITSAAAGEGDVSVTNTAGTVTFSSALGAAGANELNGLTLAASSTTDFQSTVDADTLSASGAATFRAAVVLDETFTTADNSTITLGTAFIAGTTVIASTGSEGTLDQTANTVTLNMDPTFSTGTLTLVNDANALDATDAASFNVTDTALVNYTVAIGSSNIEVTAVKNSAASIASSLGVSASAAGALDNAVTAAAADAVVSGVFATVLTAGGAEATKAAEQLEPTQVAGAAAAMGGNASTVTSIVSGRLASVRGESNVAYASRGHSGFAAGDGAMNKSIWLRPFISSADQDNSADADGGNIDGYGGSTVGMAAGIDGMVSDKTRIGFSFSYADTGIDGDGLQNDTTDIESYQITGYADYTTDKYYLEGMLSFGYSDVNTHRDITFGGLNLQATGNYDADQYTARIGAGMPIIRGRHTFTPNAAFQYTHVESDSFTETGAGVLNLVVAPEDLDMAVGILGMNWQSAYQSKGGTLTPQIRTSVSYDFAADEADSVSRFTGATATFTTKGAEVEELGGSVGAGLTLSTADGSWDVSADYDADIKSDFLAHTGRVQAKFNF